MFRLNCFLFCLVACCAEPLRIGSFNVQVFGSRFMNNEDDVRTLIRVIERYDLIALQEVRDRRQNSFPDLINRLNSSSLLASGRYRYEISTRLGRTRSKEQYGFIYRADKFQVLETYQYPDRNDIFEREPFVVHLRMLRSNGFDFSYINIHTSPRHAKQEIGALENVYAKVKQRFGENAVIGGDFNADCTYVCKSCWKKIGLFTNSKFTWLIGHNEDTAVSAKDCAYDRFVVAGSDMTSSCVNATVFRFDLEYGVTYKRANNSFTYPIHCYGVESCPCCGNADIGKKSDVVENIEQKLKEKPEYLEKEVNREIDSEYEALQTKRISDHYPIEFILDD